MAPADLELSGCPHDWGRRQPDRRAGWAAPPVAVVFPGGAAPRKPRRGANQRKEAAPLEFLFHDGIRARRPVCAIPPWRASGMTAGDGGRPPEGVRSVHERIVLSSPYIRGTLDFPYPRATLLFSGPKLDKYQ